MKRLDLRGRLNQKKRIKLIKLAILAILAAMLVHLLFNLVVRLPANQSKPIDAIFVLGGSIRREIYAARLAKQYPKLPILISQGSKDPCIWLIFQREKARLDRVWLEKCANSTFENFFFSTPLLKRWQVRKVKLVTSATHLPRAKYLADILLGAQGIAVEIETPQEKGVPGNNESSLKTRLDVTRSLIWAFFSQAIYPPCFDVIELSKVNLFVWRQVGFQCERQGRINDIDNRPQKKIKNKQP